VWGGNVCGVGVCVWGGVGVRTCMYVCVGVYVCVFVRACVRTLNM